jgi:hypothetical protein
MRLAHQPDSTMPAACQWASLATLWRAEWSLKPDEPMDLEIARRFHLRMLGLNGIRPTPSIVIAGSGGIHQGSAELPGENSCLARDQGYFSKSVLLRCRSRTNSRTLCGQACMWLAGCDPDWVILSGASWFPACSTWDIIPLCNHHYPLLHSCTFLFLHSSHQTNSSCISSHTAYLVNMLSAFVVAL